MTEPRRLFSVVKLAEILVFLDTGLAELRSVLLVTSSKFWPGLTGSSPSWLHLYTRRSQIWPTANYRFWFNNNKKKFMLMAFLAFVLKRWSKPFQGWVHTLKCIYTTVTAIICLVPYIRQFYNLWLRPRGLGARLPGKSPGFSSHVIQPNVIGWKQARTTVACLCRIA